MRILRLVLRPYQPIRFGDFRRYPRIERADSGIVWSLDQIVLGETGLWIDTTVLRWARVEPAVGVALAGLRWELLKHWNQWWQGFSQVRDDLDTSYTRVLNCVEPTAPLAVDFDGAEAGLLDPAVNCLHIMATQQLREYWRPGVPNTARMLYLDGDLEIEAVCLLPDAPWTMPRHWSLGPVHYGIGPIW